MATTGLESAAAKRQLSAQGSISIQRLRTGDLLYITLEIANGKPLYQALYPDLSLIHI